jgi:hypothetical protein
MPKKLHEGGPVLHPKQPLADAYREQGVDTQRSRAARDEAGLMARTTARLGSKYAENYKGVAASGPAKPGRKLTKKETAAAKDNEDGDDVWP